MHKVYSTPRRITMLTLWSFWHMVVGFWVRLVFLFFIFYIVQFCNLLDGVVKGGDKFDSWVCRGFALGECNECLSFIGEVAKFQFISNCVWFGLVLWTALLRVHL